MNSRQYKFKIDENLPLEVADLLSQFGYDVETVLSEGLEGSNDDILFQTCKTEKRIFITFDLDFSDIRAYPPGTHPGIIVIRLDDQSVGETLSTINKIIPAFKEETPDSKLWIVEKKKIRIRDTE